MDLKPKSIFSDPDITWWEEAGLYQIKIKLDNPLRWVNSYMLPGPEGWVLLDPGPRTPASERAWSQALTALRIGLQDIAAVVITHHHPDHFGLAGWFQETGGVPVYMSERAFKEAGLMWGTDSRINDELPAWFASHGMAGLWLEQLPEHLDSFIPQVTPMPRITILSDGGSFAMGGRRWLLVETAGHAPGHMSFYQQDSGMLLCGDAVLPQISPNVSLLPGSDAAPLRLYLQGLRRLRELPVRAAFPGHRNPFTHYRERIDALLEHHEERLDTLAGMLSTAGSLTAFEACTTLFGDRLGIHQMRFAMCETLAHLAELTDRGRALMKQAGSSAAFAFIPAGNSPE